jgi:hypothetical protein
VRRKRDVLVWLGAGGTGLGRGEFSWAVRRKRDALVWLGAGGTGWEEGVLKGGEAQARRVGLVVARAGRAGKRELS